MRRSLLAAMLGLLTVAGCDLGTGPDDRPPHVVIRSVAPASSVIGGWAVPTSMENTGGDGHFMVRFYAPPEEDPGGAEQICAQSSQIFVPAGWSESDSWSVPCGPRPTTITVRSHDPESGEFIETGREPIPAP